jgi:hypothetical protein
MTNDKGYRLLAIGYQPIGLADSRQPMAESPTRHSSFGNSSFASSFVIRHSSFVIRHSSFLRDFTLLAAHR